MNLGHILSRLRRETSGLALTEFALGAPFLLTAGLWGIETANFAVLNMKVGQLAVHIADNGSRIGDTSTLADRRIYEADINDLLIGAHIQGGEKMALYEHGRVIISSLETDDATGGQYIHWQRCRGKRNAISGYGNAGDGLAAQIDGMGPDGEEVIAQSDDAVIFVEISYEYQPLVSEAFLGGNRNISTISSFTVRDDRDLSQIYQRDPGSPDEVSSCDTYNGTPTV